MDNETKQTPEHLKRRRSWNALSIFSETSRGILPSTTHPIRIRTEAQRRPSIVLRQQSNIFDQNVLTWACLAACKSHGLPTRRRSFDIHKRDSGDGNSRGLVSARCVRVTIELIYDDWVGNVNHQNVFENHVSNKSISALPCFNPNAVIRVSHQRSVNYHVVHIRICARLS